jgi:radical SAM superfamily enzyme YgiQ (UPF0313 family)
MKPCLLYTIWLPGETKEDIEKTIKMISTLLPHDIGISVSYPLPVQSFMKKYRRS